MRSFSSSTLAQMMATSAMVPEVIHIFSPLSTYSLPTLLGAGAHAAGVRAEVGLSQAEAAELLAFLHRRQPGLLLLFAAELVNGIHAQRRLHADKAAHAGVAALEFLGHEAVFDVAHAGAAIALQRRAEKAEFGHGLDQFAREASGAVAFFDDGDEIVFDELARGVAD